MTVKFNEGMDVLEAKRWELLWPGNQQARAVGTTHCGIWTTRFQHRECLSGVRITCPLENRMLNGYGLILAFLPADAEEKGQGSYR